MLGVQKRQSLKIRSCSNQINELNAQISDLRRRLDESNNSKQSLEQIATAVGRATTSTTTATLATHQDMKPFVLKCYADGDNDGDGSIAFPDATAQMPKHDSENLVLGAVHLNVKPLIPKRCADDIDDIESIVPSAKKLRE